MANVFDEYKGLSRQERAERGSAAVGEIFKFCQSEGLDEQATVNFLCHLTRLFVSVDRVCSQGEYNLFVDLTGSKISTDEFFEMTNHGSGREYVRDCLDLIKSMSEDARYAVAIFGLCICSADGEVTEAEKEMILETIR